MTRRTLGVAIPVPPPYSGQLQDWRQRLGDPMAGAIPPHVTLLPPARFDADDVPGVVAHLSKVAAAASAFDLVLRGSGTFRPVSAVVFVPVAYGISGCESLEAAIRSGPLAMPLNFPYHPHVTVAHDLPDGVLDRAFDELGDFEAEFRATDFWLYEHGKDGVWRPVQPFALCAEAGGDAFP